MARSRRDPLIYNRPRGPGLVGFRYSNYDTPFWVRPNSSPGRWAVPEDGPTQYLSLHPDGAWADLARRENLCTDDELATVRTKIWIAEIRDQLIVDYSTFENAERAGLPPLALVSDDHGLCQEEGRRLRQLNLAGVLAPSAAVPGVFNLTLFGPRRRIQWGTNSELKSTIPSAIVALGSPNPGIAPRVRHYGNVHADYQAYLETAKKT